MKAVSRRREKRRDLIESLSTLYPFQHDFSYFEESSKFLESTGSIVLDRVNKVAFMVISERSSLDVVKAWGELLNYHVVAFEASSRNAPIYHTNIVLSIGCNWVVVCYEVIHPDQREHVKASMEKLGKEIIEITENQLNNFCGNILELKGHSGTIIAMSSKSYQAFTPNQLSILEKSSKIVTASIPVIERIGGGSVRCMIAELF